MTDEITLGNNNECVCFRKKSVFYPKNGKGRMSRIIVTHDEEYDIFSKIR